MTLGEWGDFFRESGFKPNGDAEWLDLPETMTLKEITDRAPAYWE